MGYRSDVMCIMYAADAFGHTDKGSMAIIKAWVKNRLANDEHEMLERFDFQDDMVVFEAQGWKWYESYTDIAMLDKLFADFTELCNEGENTYHIEFIRIGENTDDIEIRESNYCRGWLRVSRSIYIDK